MFKEQCDALFEELGTDKIMCLATSLRNKVSARSMSVIIYNEKFYFQTDASYNKYKQLTKNHYVALCFSNVQIEGACKDLGSPMLAKNSFFASLYKQVYPESYERYTEMESERLFEVAPTFITLWKFDKSNPYRVFYDFKKKVCKQENYEINK